MLVNSHLGGLALGVAAVEFRLHLPERSEAVRRSRQYIERCENIPDREEAPF
jgi:hypothetical protein